MTKLPNIHAMDPDDWHDAITELAGDFEEKIQSVLDETTSSEEAKERLYPYLEPYFIDPDDPTLAEQLLVWIDEDDMLCIGVPHGDYTPVVYHGECDHWWYDRDEIDDAPETPAECHRQIAEYAVGCTAWGDVELAMRRVDWAKTERRLGTAYLEKLEETLQAGDPSAAELRDHLIDFMQACAPKGSSVEIRDISPDDRRTRLELRTDGEVNGHILAVEPGTSIEWDDLYETFDVDEESVVLIGTDHLRLKGQYGMFEALDLKLPSQKAEDLATYNTGVGVLVTAFRSAMSHR